MQKPIAVTFVLWHVPWHRACVDWHSQRTQSFHSFPSMVQNLLTNCVCALSGYVEAIKILSLYWRRLTIPGSLTQSGKPQAVIFRSPRERRRQRLS